MKKSLIALAVSLVATGAYANDHQEHQPKSGDTVQIYGLIDQGYTKLEEKITHEGADVNVENKFGIKSGTSGQSRIGLRGVEHLGAGSRAGFVFELGIEPNTDVTPLTVRQGYVSLENDSFGKLAIGRQHTFTYNAIKDGTYGVINLPGNLAFNREKAFDHGNVVSYGLSGEYFTISGAYGTNTHETKDNTGSLKHDFRVYELGAGLKYKGFGLKAGYADANNTTNGSNVGSKSYFAGTDYDFGFLKVGYTFYRTTADVGSEHVEPLLTKSNAQVHQLAATAPITNTVDVFGSYVLLKGSLKIDGHDINANGNGFQVGTRYHFSKRTSIYGAYGQQKVGVDYNYGAKSYGYTVGLRHQF